MLRLLDWVPGAFRDSRRILRAAGRALVATLSWTGGPSYLARALEWLSGVGEGQGSAEKELVTASHPSSVMLRRTVGWLAGKTAVGFPQLRSRRGMRSLHQEGRRNVSF